LIGRGGFGEVWLVQDRITFELFAMKVLSKADVISREWIANVRAERDILATTNNPWVIKLEASFQDASNLYLLLEYLPGGDLMTVLERRKVLPEATARFFIGEIALALQSIHSLNVIHRDIKPDNVLIGEDGHIKLTDFGLSTNFARDNTELEQILEEVQELLQEKFKPGRVPRDAQIVGTHSYIAPEVFRREAPTYASDYWSLGVMLYEMLYGYLPFRGKSPVETALRIVHCRKALRFPPRAGISAEAVDLLKHLLCGAEQRYGFAEIAAHPFFKGFDFWNVRANIPPMVPVLRHPADTTHFARVAPDSQRVREIDADGALADVLFLGFTYKKVPRNRTLDELGVFSSVSA
jgi:serine/threonine protein kinase